MEYDAERCTAPTNGGHRTTAARAWDRIALLSLLVFLGVTATVGGIGIALDKVGLSLAWLDGSVFTDYMIHGLALIGVLASVAAILMQGQYQYGSMLAILAGLAIGVYETVEVFVIPFHWLRIFYMMVGLVIILLVGLVRVDNQKM